MLYTINNSPDLSYYSYFVFKYTEGIEAKKVELKISAGGEIYIFLKEKEIALKRVRRWNIIQQYMDHNQNSCIFVSEFQQILIHRQNMIVNPKTYKKRISPLKNFKPIGRLVLNNLNNPEQSQTKQISNIGINTSKLTKFQQKGQEQKGSPKFSFNSGVYEVHLSSSFDHRAHSQNKSINNKSEEIHENERQKEIKSQKFSESEPQLPPISKFQRRQQKYNSFLDKINLNSTQKFKKEPYMNHRMKRKESQKIYNSAIFAKKQDTQEQELLRHPRLDKSLQKKQPQSYNYSSRARYEEEEYQNYSDSFVREYQNNSRVKKSLSNENIVIDVKTPISKIKQLLVEGDEELYASFIIPQAFFTAPSQNCTSKDLHELMLLAFSSIDKVPQIISIKKYTNCVVMRDTKLCIVWNFNGKVYFGGWTKNNMLTEGNKHGIGLEWVPGRYIYYGEFRDNRKQGYGIMKKMNKQVYVGCWKDNQRHGWGKIYNEEGRMSQNGEFEEGCLVRGN